MTSLITSQRGVKFGWLQEMDTDSAYMSNSQYMQSYWFLNKSNINILYNISVMTITITIIIILANFGKYAISDCLFILSVCLLLAKIYILASLFVGRVCLFVICQNLILASMFVGHVCLLLAKITILASMLVGRVCLLVCLSVCTEISQNLMNESFNHHQTWSQASITSWFLQVRWTRIQVE